MPLYPPTGGTINLSSPPPIGNTTPNSIIGSVVESVDYVSAGGGNNILGGDGSGNFAGSLIAWDAAGNFTIASLAAFVSDVQFNSTIEMLSLPTTDPHNFGEVWSNLGIATISAG